MALQINPKVQKDLNTALMAANTQKWIKEAVPQTMRKYLTPERMARVALAAFTKSPALWGCSVSSVVKAVIDAASLGLEPVGGPLAHGYLVPFKGDCVFMISYQGLIELARRSGEFRSIEANAVYEKDKLVVRYGDNGCFQHEPYIGKDERGGIVGAYCVATFANDERHVTWMPVRDIERRKAVSAGVKSGKQTPWDDWYDEMCVKTVIKKAAKLWPKTPELVSAMSMEDAGVHSDAAQVIDSELDPSETIAPTTETASSPGLVAPPPTAAARLAAKMKKRREPEPAPAAEELQAEEPPPWEKHLEEENDGDAA